MQAKHMHSWQKYKCQVEDSERHYPLFWALSNSSAIKKKQGDYNSQKTLRSYPLRTLNLGDCIGQRARGAGLGPEPRIGAGLGAGPRRGRCCRRGPEHASGAEDGGGSSGCSRDLSWAEAEEPPALTSLWLRFARRSVCEAPRERPGGGAATAAEERAGSGPPRPPAPPAPRLLGGAAAAMFSVLSYGRLVARAVLGGLSQTDPRAGGGGGGDYGLVTAGCGFGKDFRKGLLKKGACYGDDACFVARHRSADVLEPTSGSHSAVPAPGDLVLSLGDTCRHLISLWFRSSAWPGDPCLFGGSRHHSLAQAAGSPADGQS
ncbi:hypothetical protein P7K49_020257 [Saguinus oedipus]|uniref:Uncharacterized protein n=1 Tax=Saguinus oedipus TaxID=9490 RepID=A0ABQ9UZV7_SAGOE|nr:hypothetical protein P7K49_020257 [Saguinus oedipus]